MSLVTRLLGFGLCLLGAFTAGYYQSFHSTAGIINGVVINYAGSTPDFNSAILAQVATYIQQNVPSAWASYVVVGIVMAIAGSVLVALGDRKLMSAKK